MKNGLEGIDIALTVNVENTMDEALSNNIYKGKYTLQVHLYLQSERIKTLITLKD